MPCLARHCLLLPLLLVGLLCDTADAQPEPPRLVQLSSPAPANSHLSRVTSDESGQLYVSWVTQRGAVAELAFAQREGSVWSDATVISRGADWFVNWADFPTLSVNAGGIAAHWLRRTAEGAYDYDIVARFYDANLRQWSEPRTINTDGIDAEHGFVSMLPLSENRTLLSWLDGRNTKTQPTAGPMSLRAGIYDAGGHALDERELDARVCDCCQTSSALTAQGPIVVYRDRSASEIRDIAAVRLVDGEWTQPQAVHRDDWRVSGCPVNGPAAAARGKRVAVAWFTAKDDLPKVQLALSNDSGESFSLPTLVAETTTNGRVGAAILSSGDVVVSWMRVVDATAQVMLSRFDPNGVLMDTVEVADTSASRRSGFPVIEAVGQTVYVTWTDIGADMRVKVARVDY